MQGDRHAADVPAVAGREEGQHADRGVLGGVQGSAEDLRVDPGSVQLVLGDRPPHGAGAQRPRREVELRLTQDLAGDEAPAQEGDHLVGDLDGAVAQAPVAPGDLDVGLQDRDRRRVAGDRRVCGCGLLDQRDGVLQIQGADEIRAALVEVHGALVDRRVGGAGVHRAQQPARPGLDDLDRPPALPADVGQVGGPLPTRPVPGPRPAAQQPGRLQLGKQLLAGGAEQRQVVVGQGQFGRRRAQVGGEYVRVVGVEDRGLHGLVEQGLGVVDEEGVQRIVAGHQHREGSLPGPPRPARLLPQRRPGARVAGDHHGVQAGDVEAEFQGVRRREAEEFTGVQGTFQGATFLGEVAAAVRRHAPGQRAVDLGQTFLGDHRDQLGATPGAYEGDGAHPLHGEVGEQVGGLGGGRAADRRALLALQLGQRRFPEGEHQFTAR